jgi:hypothetical protein
MPGREAPQDAGAPAPSPAGLAEWVQRLKEREMPVFSRTVRRLNQAMEDERSGILEMSRIILEDPALTAKLLKLGNSLHYNPGRQPLGTITRAVVMIGLDAVHELALACSFIDAMLARRNRERVRLEIARALHAAVQAKSLAQLAGDGAPEEAFVAALLHNIGQLAFWCFEDNQGAAIDALTARGYSPEKAEREVLGFRLDQLGAGLCKAWSLGGLIEKCHAGLATPRTNLVKAGSELARLAERGWNDPQMLRRLEKIAEQTGKTIEEIQARVKSNAEAAVKLAEQLGARASDRYIPHAETVPSGVAEEAPARGESAMLQIMGDIANLLSGEVDLNLAFETVIEGIYRAVDMDRVLFALMTPDRKLLKEKSALGWPPAAERESLSFPLAATPHNLFSWAVERNEALWARQDREALFTPSLRARLGLQECLIAPIGLNRRVIGLFYADRALSKRPLNQDCFDGFLRLVQQANIALRLSQPP